MSITYPSRAPTPIIPQSSANADSISQNSLAVVRTCYCAKLISPGMVDVAGRASPSNDEIKFFYKGHKYKCFVSGKGIFYIVRNKGGELTLVRDKKITEFPCCDSMLRCIVPMI